MNKNFEKDYNLGGSVDKALSGQYELKAGAILKEAWQITLKQFLAFSPAVVVLMVVQGLIFYIAMQLQLGGMDSLYNFFTKPEVIDPKLFSAIYISVFSMEVISAPIHASLCLMAMTHAAGLKTQMQHIGKGLQFTTPLIIMTLGSLILQGVGGMLIPLISFYLAVAFSHATLLICEKRIPPLQSLWVSLRAVNKKFFVVASLYLFVLLMFVVAMMFYGFGIIIVFPFFFHLKGILYRETFGIRLRIVAKSDTHNNDDHDQIFNA